MLQKYLYDKTKSVDQATKLIHIDDIELSEKQEEFVNQAEELRS